MDHLPGACDSHLHVYGPFSRYPLPPERSFDPPEVPEPAIRAMHDRLGFDRAVLVHSLGHGMDYRPMLDALQAGAGRYRGVAILAADTPAETVAALDAAGVCGLRFNFLPHLGGRPDLAAMEAAMALAAPYGWHVAVHVAGDGLIETEAFIRRLAPPVVIDHMARPDLRAGLDSPAVQTLLRLLDTGRVWVKLSGCDRISIEGAPYHDAAALARKLADHAPDRVLWGTDSPHVNIAGPMPDDQALVDLIPMITPTEAGRRAILVDNPARFFGFP